MSDELQHFGVKGMRWGVRKGRSGASRSTSREAAKDYIKKKQVDAILKKAGL